MRNVLLFFFAIILGVWSAGCQSRPALSVMQAWARPAASGENSAVYFVIDNPTADDDALLAASTEVAAQVELHMSMMSEGSTMTMHPQELVNVPAKSRVEFKPGGLHVMLIGLKQELKVGDRFTLRLKFQRAGEIAVDVEVKQP